MKPFYKPEFIDLACAAMWFDFLRADLDWERRENAPRSEYWTNLNGTPYTYGQGRGIRTYEHREDHSAIIGGRDRLAAYARDMLAQFSPACADAKFEGCFLNWYQGGRDWLGWHADDDPGIDHTKPIAIITLGAPRRLEWKPQGAKGVEAIEGVLLEPGSLLLMPPGMQQTHFHRIPKAVDDQGERISMTYRCLV